MPDWIIFAAGVFAGAAGFRLLLFFGLTRQRAGAIALGGSILLLPWAAWMAIPAERCADYGCGILVLAWVWISAVLLVGSALGVFALLLAPWGSE